MIKRSNKILLALNAGLLVYLLFCVFSPLVTYQNSELYKSLPDQTAKGIFWEGAKLNAKVPGVIFIIYGLSMLLELLIWKIFAAKSRNIHITRMFFACSWILLFVRVCTLIYIFYLINNLLSF